MARRNGCLGPCPIHTYTYKYAYTYTYTHINFLSVYFFSGVLLCPCYALLGCSRFCALAGFEGTATRTVYKLIMAAQSEVGLQIYDGEYVNMDDPGMTDADMLNDGQSTQALLLTPVGDTSGFDHETIKLSI